MKALAEVQITPIGTGVSVRKQVERAHGLLRESGLKTELHAYGTNVEGELGAIFDAVERVHEELHAEGTQRLSTNVKIGTRTDKDTSLEDKRIDMP